MKYFKLIVLLMVASSFTVFADSYDDISNAIRTGNSKQLVNYIGTNIDLTIVSQEGVYSKIHAEQILRNFFATNVPQSFTVLHKGSTKEGNMFIIGTFVTKGGKTYRTSLYLKQSEKIILKEIRFESE